jgi:biopolymer transport protein ExbB/TolQ
VDHWVSLAQHAAERSAKMHVEQMSRSLGALATIAASAPFVGMIGTIFGIIGCFRGVDGEKFAIMASIADGLSQSMMPAALGLAIAITALWGYKCLSSQIEAFQVEMQNAILELTNFLAGYGT